MIEEVIEAFKNKDYQTAARLLRQLAQDEPNNPWVQIYIAHLHEVKQQLKEAETIYRKLLIDSTNPKIISQARQGLKRLETIEKEERKQALNQANADPNNQQFGVLLLEPIDPQNKSNAAKTLAKIMQIDPYTARLQLPTRGWRIYRTGPVGELQFYASSLQSGSIPCFWVKLVDIQNINIFNVKYFSESNSIKTTIICQNPHGEVGSLTFNWSEVTQSVEGRLPLFEQVVDVDARHKLQRKTKTLDYINFCDLHLPARKSILRINDLQYQFQQGIRLSSKTENTQNGAIKIPILSQATNRINWNKLRNFINLQLPQIPIWSDFTSFAETAIDYKEMLSRLPAHIDLLRREETPWDSAFQLYSGLAFLKNTY
ncbi:tetratricopeptide repeat protein [Limnofasciculus baicalensis]|uniref:Tetratricopeptide repeat protein n=1 Tax=Limnofasciculus baicalensis BBK-W-15 TaxID=2699891 RepID=A0AAE3GS07_9CYAN|nr:tetratricopeptide repeat protein [Limnofasciculus baicalensis]MCP2728778.1 tetratricopeptide repeat protein [Limnofasciculus baicalensis BBK-W-15]